MKQAKDFIVFPLDVPTIGDAKNLIHLLSGHVGMFKVGLELFIQAGPDIIRAIKQAGDTKIFLDLKLHDIPETVSRAMKRVSELGISFATVHCGENPKMLEVAVSASRGAVSVLGVTILTSVSGEDIRSAGYREEFGSDPARLVLKKAEAANAAGCAGVICSGHEAPMIKQAFGKAFLAVTPGIRPESNSGALDDQKRVMTPAWAIENGADYLVIGRPIRDARDPRAAAIRIAEEIETALNL